MSGYIIKLVRDEVGERVGPARSFHYERVANYDQHVRLLRAKLLEEAGEYLTAPQEIDRFKELVDLYQVIVDLAKIDLGVDFGLIQEAANFKAEERGRFLQGTIMVATDEGYQSESWGEHE